jgi:hypothetical protein
MVELKEHKKIPSRLKEWPIVQWRLTFQNGKTMNWGFNMG